MNHTKHSKRALLHLLDLGILSLSDTVKQASKPLICCGTVTTCLLLKLSKPSLWSSTDLLCCSTGLLSCKHALSLLLYQLLK
jgi:hypothetical protein